MDDRPYKPGDWLRNYYASRRLRRPDPEPKSKKGWPKQRSRIRKKLQTGTNKRCWYCGAKFSKDRPLTIDHVEPISRGGAQSAIANMVPACQPCNAAKGAMTLAEYREKVGVDAFYGERQLPAILKTATVGDTAASGSHAD